MAVTLRTDRQGLAIIDRARVNKDWSALALSWCEEAKVSLSTLKRFRERKAIQKDAFIAICSAVGIKDWQRVVARTEVVAKTEEDVSVLRKRYRQSKRVIAEEVLSNLNSLEARLDFVEQAFSNDPTEAQRQIDRINKMSAFEQKRQLTYHSQGGRHGANKVANKSANQTAEERYRLGLERTDSSSNAGSQALFQHCSLKLEANVAIIQIMMEI